MTALQPLPLDRTTVTASAAQYLRDQILGGQLSAGAALPETRLGAALGVSRAPVREALTQLEREGLVVFDRRGTARVCTFGPADIRELGQMRLALEPAAARLACERLAPSAVAALQANLQQLRAAKTLAEVTRRDIEFHRLVVMASGNGRLLRAWEQLAGPFHLVMSLFHRAIETRTRTTREQTQHSHAKLLTLLCKGTPEQNAAAAAGHASGWLEGWDGTSAAAPE